MSEQNGSTGAGQDAQGFLGRITNAPSSSQGSLREVARVVLPEAKDLDALPLYVDGPLRKERSSGSSDEVAEHPDDILSRRSMRIRSGRRVSFGSYFNAFPASYWRRWTVAEKVVLSVATTGAGSLIVYRSNARGISQRVENVRLPGGSQTSEFDLTLAPFGDGGWYWFDLIADEEGMVLDSAAWSVPDTAPQGTVTLGVTTFNRPDYCVNTIRTIAEADGFDDVLDELIIVDQGNRLV